MRQETLVSRARWLLPLLMLVVAALACNLSGQPPQATATPEATAPTLIALSDVPEVAIRSPADNTEVLVRTEVQIYVRAVDRVGVTRIEMRVNGLLVDTAASPEVTGTTTMDSILAWTPASAGPQVIQVLAFRGNVRGNPKNVTLIVRDNPAQITRPAGSPVFLTASPTNDPTCRVRVDVNGLNLRSGPGLNYDVIQNLPFGTILPVTGSNEDRSWWQVSYQGLIGWTSGAYTTQLGNCANVILAFIPASPTVQPGATAFIIPPTFTPLPLLPQPTPTSTIPIIVLPTLTSTVFVQPTVRQPSIGDLSSTAIFATQTALAQPTATLTPTITLTPQPGVTLPTATNTLTPTLTPTPLRADLTITAIIPATTNVVLNPAQPIANLPITIKVKNNGQAPAPVFQVSITQPNGTTAGTFTQIVLDPGVEIDVPVIVTLTQVGAIPLAIIVDSTNVVIENNKNDNVASVTINVALATAPAPTTTSTSTATRTLTPAASFTSTSTSTQTVPPAATATSTATQTNTPGGVVTATPLIIVSNTPTATRTSTPTLTPPPGVTLPTAAPTFTPSVTRTNTPTLTPPPGVTLPTATPTFTPSATRTNTPTFTPPPGVTLATFTPTFTPTRTLTATATVQVVVPTLTATATPTTAVVVLPSATSTATRTATAVPPTATLAPTVAPPTATATFTASPIPPTRTNTATVTVPPPTATFTASPIPPTKTNTPTATLPPPTATRTPTLAPTVPPPTNTPTRTFTPTATVPPPTATPTATTSTLVDMKTVPVKPNLVDPQLLNKVKQIHARSKAPGRQIVQNEFSIVGDPTLLGIADVNQPGMNLDQFAPVLQPIVTYFAPAFPKVGPTFAACQNPPPRPALQCALDAKSTLAFVSMGGPALAANTPLPQFVTDLTNTVKGLDSAGIIPILVTIPGPVGDPRVNQYNNAILQVSGAENVPLFNVYAIGANNPALINGAQLNDPGPGQRAVFTAAALGQFGVNVANLNLLEILNDLKTAVPIP